MKTKRCVSAVCKLKAKLIQENTKIREYVCKCGCSWTEDVKIMEKNKK